MQYRCLQLTIYVILYRHPIAHSLLNAGNVRGVATHGAASYKLGHSQQHLLKDNLYSLNECKISVKPAHTLNTILHMRFTMNISQLFTTSGLTQALQTHHKHLHKHYNFPPLSGIKSIHKLAETFGFKGAEPFLSALKDIEEQHLSTTVNLMSKNDNTLVHIEIEKDLGSTQLRVIPDNESALIICTIDESQIAPFIVRYQNSQKATIFIGHFAIVVELDHDELTANVFQSMNNQPLIVKPSALSENNAACIDQQSMSLTSYPNDNFHSEDSEELMESFSQAISLSCDNDDFCIHAVASSDDDNISIEFDAKAYFESERSKENFLEIIQKLNECDFDADYPTDTVAEYFSDSTTKRLFTYLHSINPEKNIGYRCTISKEDVERWMKKENITVI